MKQQPHLSLKEVDSDFLSDLPAENSPYLTLYDLMERAKDATRIPYSPKGGGQVVWKEIPRDTLTAILQIKSDVIMEFLHRRLNNVQLVEQAHALLQGLLFDIGFNKRMADGKEWPVYEIRKRYLEDVCRLLDEEAARVKLLQMQERSKRLDEKRAEEAQGSARRVIRLTRDQLSNYTPEVMDSFRSAGFSIEVVEHTGDSSFPNAAHVQSSADPERTKVLEVQDDGTLAA